MPFQGCLPFQLATDSNILPVLSLREAAHGARRHTVISKCNCRKKCETKRCPCKSAGLDCSTHCHPKHPDCSNRGDLLDNRQIECEIIGVEEQNTPLSLLERRKRKLESSTSRSSKRGKRNADVTLELSNKELDVIRNGEWLTDQHMRLALTLLKKQFPNMDGLHDTLYGCDLSFPKTSHPFVQILNISNQHWVTIASSSSMTVRFYDSLYPSISSLTKAQISAVMSCAERKITILRQKTQFQAGGSDCGLFAIAYATDLCLGQEPASVRYNQQVMRSHLLECLLKKKFTPFPSKKGTQLKPTKDFIDIYCSCRLPEQEGDRMAQCGSCDEWYHKTCQKIPEVVFSDQDADWKCSNCI